MKQFLKRTFAFLFALVICFSFPLSSFAYTESDDPIYYGTIEFGANERYIMAPVTLNFTRTFRRFLRQSSSSYNIYSYTQNFIISPEARVRSGLTGIYYLTYFSSRLSISSSGLIASGYYPSIQLSQSTSDFPDLSFYFDESDNIYYPSGSAYFRYYFQNVNMPQYVNGTTTAQTFDCQYNIISCSDCYVWQTDNHLARYVGIDGLTVTDDCEFSIYYPMNWVDPNEDITTTLSYYYVDNPDEIYTVTMDSSLYEVIEDPDSNLYVYVITIKKDWIFSQSSPGYSSSMAGVAHVVDFEVTLPVANDLVNLSVNSANENIINYTYVPGIRNVDVVEKITPEVELVDYSSWIGHAVSGFLDLQIMPGVSLGGIFMCVIAFAMVVWFIKLFAGG